MAQETRERVVMAKCRYGKLVTSRKRLFAYLRQNAVTIERVKGWPRQLCEALEELTGIPRYKMTRSQYQVYIASKVELEGRDITKQTPKWANRDNINNIYKRCREISKISGIKHHVDHIVPLQGKMVSGLHVEANLQIITATQNLSKGNKFGVRLRPPKSVVRQRSGGRSDTAQPRVLNLVRVGCKATTY